MIPAHPLVYIVDDSEEDLFLYTECISKSAPDWRIRTFRRSEDALSSVQGGVFPDLILSDYRMPGMTGAQMITELRIQAGRQIPSVLFSGVIPEERDIQVMRDLIHPCVVLQKTNGLPLLVDAGRQALIMAQPLEEARVWRRGVEARFDDVLDGIRMLDTRVKALDDRIDSYHEPWIDEAWAWALKWAERAWRWRNVAVGIVVTLAGIAGSVWAWLTHYHHTGGKP